MPARLGSAPHAPARVSPVEDEPGEPFGMPRRVHERHRGSLRDAEQREALETRRRDDGLEIRDPRLDGEIAELAVGQAASALVVPDDRVAVPQLGQPVAPDRALPVEVEVRQPRRRPHERRSAAVDGVRQPNTIPGGAEAHLLLHTADPTSAARPRRVGFHGGGQATSGVANSPNDEITACARRHSGPRSSATGTGDRRSPATASAGSSLATAGLLSAGRAAGDSDLVRANERTASAAPTAGSVRSAPSRP